VIVLVQIVFDALFIAVQAQNKKIKLVPMAIRVQKNSHGSTMAILVNE